MYCGQVVRTLVSPLVEPIHLDEAKLFLRIELTDTGEDALLRTLISAARQEAEAFLRRALVDQTLETVLDRFPARGPIWLLRPPLMSFTKFEYRGTDGLIAEWPAANYQVDFRSTPARIERAYAQSWPIIRGAEDINSVVLTYRAGYDLPVSTDASTDKLASTAHPFINGDQVRYRNAGGVIAGLSESVTYYVVGATANDFQLSLSAGGAAVDITGAPAGQAFIARATRTMPKTIVQAMLQSIAHWYENRESVIVGTIAAVLPHAARRLLWPHRVMGW